MLQLRTSCMQDVPRLRELWKLAFGDEDAYIDHFFERYYTPDRMLVLEESGQVQAMTAWFDMPLVGAEGEWWSAAYLYAVATHPDCRGRGVAGRLLAFADQWLEERGFVCVTTVPARADLHVFFGQNGFSEGLSLRQEEYSPQTGVEPLALERVDARDYARLRETALQGRSHTAYSQSALDYQCGICALSGGGLYRVGETGCACVERAGEEVFVKELLCTKSLRGSALAAVAWMHPAQRYWVRTPCEGEGTPWAFAMLKWLGPVPKWEGKLPPYLGLAFD